MSPELWYLSVRIHNTIFENTIKIHYCVTSRKVAGSIPDGVIGFFFIDIILPAALWPWGRLSLYRNEYQECLLGVKVAGA